MKLSERPQSLHLHRQWRDKYQVSHSSELDADQDSYNVTPNFAKNSKCYERKEAAAEPVLTGAKLLKSVLEPVQHGCSQIMSDFSEVRKQVICDKDVSASEVTNSSVAVSTHSYASDNLFSTRVAHCSSSGHIVSLVSTTTCPLSSTSSLLCPQTELCDSSSTSTVLQLGSLPASDSLSQTVFTSGAIASIIQQVDSEESFDLTVMNQDGFQSPNMPYSSTSSSPACHHVISIAQQDFNPDSSYYGSLSVDTDLSPLCSTFSPRMERAPLTVANVPSITSISVPNSQTSCLVPCSFPVDFDSYVPSSINFSRASFLPNCKTFNFSTSLDGCISETRLHDGSVDPNGSVMQQMFDEASKYPNITGVDLSLPGDSSMFTDSILSLSHHRGNFPQNSEPATSASAQRSPNFVSRLLFESQAIYLCASNNSSPKIKNVFQKFT